MAANASLRGANSLFRAARTRLSSHAKRNFSVENTFRDKEKAVEDMWIRQHEHDAIVASLKREAEKAKAAQEAAHKVAAEVHKAAATAAHHDGHGKSVQVGLVFAVGAIGGYLIGSTGK
eukprot:jgi/Mesvir1/431/Mv11312-RA.1